MSTARVRISYSPHQYEIGRVVDMDAGEAKSMVREGRAVYFYDEDPADPEPSPSPETEVEQPAPEPPTVSLPSRGRRRTSPPSSEPPQAFVEN